MIARTTHEEEHGELGVARNRHARAGDGLEPVPTTPTRGRAAGVGSARLLWRGHLCRLLSIDVEVAASYGPSAPRGRAGSAQGTHFAVFRSERFDPVESLAAEGSGSLGADERDWRGSGLLSRSSEEVPCRTDSRRSQGEDRAHRRAGGRCVVQARATTRPAGCKPPHRSRDCAGRRRAARPRRGGADHGMNRRATRRTRRGDRRPRSPGRLPSRVDRGGRSRRRPKRRGSWPTRASRR